MRVESPEQFKQLVSEIEARPGYVRPRAFGLGLATFAIADLHAPAQVGAGAPALDTWYPAPNHEESYGTAAIFAQLVGHLKGSASYRLTASQLNQAFAAFTPFLNDGRVHPNGVAMEQFRASLARMEQDAARYQRGETSLDRALPRALVVTFIEDLRTGPVDAHDVYLRLHLMSSRKVRPQGLNMEGAEELLSNVVWTNVGPFSLAGFERVRGLLKSQGVHVHVLSVQKLPRMVDYVIPSGTCISDPEHVRLGAYLEDGGVG